MICIANGSCCNSSVNYHRYDIISVLATLPATDFAYTLARCLGQSTGSGCAVVAAAAGVPTAAGILALLVGVADTIVAAVGR